MKRFLEQNKGANNKLYVWIDIMKAQKSAYFQNCCQNLFKKTTTTV